MFSSLSVGRAGARRAGPVVSSHVMKAKTRRAAALPRRAPDGRAARPRRRRAARRCLGQPGRPSGAAAARRRADAAFLERHGQRPGRAGLVRAVARPARPWRERLVARRRVRSRGFRARSRRGRGHARTGPGVVGASLGGMARCARPARRSRRCFPPSVLVVVTPRLEANGVTRIISFMTDRPEGFASLEEAADAVAAYRQHRARRAISRVSRRTCAAATTAAGAGIGIRSSSARTAARAAA